MPANITEIEKRLWDAADELRANSKLKFVHSWGGFVDGGPVLRRTRDRLLPRLVAGEVGLNQLQTRF